MIHLESAKVEMKVYESYQEVEKELLRFKSNSGQEYSCYKKTKDFGCKDPVISARRILWEDALGKNLRITFDGIPFIINGRKHLDCEFGADKDKKRRKSKKTKKLGCKAAIELKDVVKFPGFKISKPNTYKKRKVIKSLKEAIEAEENIECERRFYVYLPPLGSHKGHPIGKRARPKKANIESLPEKECTKIKSRRSSDVIFVSKTKRTGIQNKRPRMILSDEEANNILSGDMLTDESINLAQNLISAQFPELQGLENTTLGPLRGFSTFQGHFIQILHTGETHWVCASNIELEDNLEAVNIYDSLNSTGRISRQTARQIIQFSGRPQLNVNIVQVQQQGNGTNCGLFAIAFATSLAFGESPLNANYDEAMMRHHLHGCLQSERISPFPTLPARLNML